MNTLVDKGKLDQAVASMDVFLPSIEIEDIDWEDNTIRTVALAERIMTMASRVEEMPEMFGQSGQGENAIAFLHYSHKGLEWYITEKDGGGEDQFQVFGAVVSEKDDEFNLANIPIQDLVNSDDIKFDFDFVPTTLNDIAREANISSIRM